MYQFPNIILNVFAKAPVLGTVKTRMQPIHPQAFSLALHCTLVDYCLTTWQASAICPVELWLAGDQSLFEEKLPQWHKLPINAQQGQDLGARLLHSLTSSFEKDNTQGVLLVGTDCPFIDSSYLTTACEAMLEHDVVIGAAEDGGYVLLGVKQAIPELFDNIDWGSDQVFAQTLSVIQSKGLSYFELPALNDIDRPEDLKSLKGIEAFTAYAQA